MRKTVLIIDTKAGNLFSLRAAIERLDYEVTILEQPDGQQFDAVVIPGQGRFGTVLKNIRANNWVPYLQQIKQQNIPMLGICVGMQIFFEASAEDKGIEGLNWYRGKVEALDFPKKPMIGWAKLTSKAWPDSIVYFVNSYSIRKSEYSIATTTYGESFCAAMREGSFTGVQFHPEKSSDAGADIIRQALMANSGVNQ